MNTIENDTAEFWIDNAGCLQPCPVCRVMEVRPSWQEVTHIRCWESVTAMQRSKLVHLRLGVLEDEIARNRG